MSKIILLNKTVADKIAAGEVVERPASVVKELLENSLDAGAKNIHINIENGGQSLIDIVDDGVGMSPEEARLSVERFATSKLRQWEDLESLQTFGFRGEALPSIAAVSRFEILTRPQESPTGSRIRIDGGVFQSQEEAGTSVGTRIRVEDIFFNTPARRKFLKSSASETSSIVSMVEKISLVNADISFRLTSNGREIFNFPSSMTLRERILKIWGIPLDYDIIPVEYETPSLRVSGYVCKPDRLKPQRTYQFFYVNSRFIKNSMLNQAVAEGFSPLLPAGKFPMALIFIDLRGEDVDINVHPNKMEVRFLRPGEIFKSVRDSIKAPMGKFYYSPAESVDSKIGISYLSDIRGAEISFEALDSKKSPEGGGKFSGLLGFSPNKKDFSPKFESLRSLDLDFSGDAEIISAPSSSRVQFFDERKPRAKFQALGQVFNTYIVGFMENDLWIVDQHTAHERINYEKLAHLGKVGEKSQTMLFPVVLDLPAALFNFLADKLEEFADMGLEIESFGGSTIKVNSVPYGFKRMENSESLMALFEEMAEEFPYKNMESFRERLRSSAACKASVKAGDELTAAEMNSLVNEFIGMDYSPYCPHGRPVMIKFSRENLERMFQRS